MIREARNAIKIENKSGRVSQVPIDPTEAIYQGDLMKWNPAVHQATKMTAAADGANFIGMSDHTNPQATAGSLTTDYTKSYTNIVQSALVSLIAGANETLHAFDAVEMVTDAQHVKKSGNRTIAVGFVDPGWAGAAGKAVVIGDEIKVWLKVPAWYNAFGQRGLDAVGS